MVYILIAGGNVGLDKVFMPGAIAIGNTKSAVSFMRFCAPPLRGKAWRQRLYERDVGDPNFRRDHGNWPWDEASPR